MYFEGKGRGWHFELFFCFALLIGVFYLSKFWIAYFLLENDRIGWFEVLIFYTQIYFWDPCVFKRIQGVSTLQGPLDCYESLAGTVFISDSLKELYYFTTKNRHELNYFLFMRMYLRVTLLKLFYINYKVLWLLFYRKENFWLLIVGCITYASKNSNQYDLGCFGVFF